MPRPASDGTNTDQDGNVTRTITQIQHIGRVYQAHREWAKGPRWFHDAKPEAEQMQNGGWTTQKEARPALLAARADRADDFDNLPTPEPIDA